MSSSEVAKIGQWDEHCLKKAIRHLPPEIDENAKSLIKSLLHYNPDLRFNSMRQVLDHPFFASSSSSRISTSMQSSRVGQTSKDIALPQAVATQSMSMSSSSPSSTSPNSPRLKSRRSRNSGYSEKMVGNDENSINGTRRHRREKAVVDDSDSESVGSTTSKRSRMFGSIRNRFKNGKKAQKA